MSDETTAEMLAEIDKDLADIEKAVAALQEQAVRANYPQQVETTTDRLAEIEGQAETQPVQVREGRWRTRAGQVRNVVAYPQDDENFTAYYPWWDGKETTWANDGRWTDRPSSMDLLEYLGPIEPEPERQPEPQPEPEPEPENRGFEGHILREHPQPVQVREGRWKTRGGEVKYIKAGGSRRDNHYSWPWTDTLMCWQDNGFYHASKPSENDLVEYLGSIEPEPEKIITPDDVAAEALAGVNDSAVVANPFQTIRELLQRNNKLATQGSQQHMQIQELRSEVSYVQGLLGESRRRVEELETLVGDLRAVNAAQEKAVNSVTRDKADLQHRLDTVAAEWALQAGTISGLEQLLEAVKAELVRQAETARRLQIELDAREQVPQAVSDRFEEGWDAGTAQAVETIAEWTEPFRQMIEKADNLVESDRASRLCAEIMQSLPAIMRSLTGLTDED